MGNWGENEVAGHPAEIFEPSERNPHGFALIYLHGVRLGRLSDRDAFTTQLEKHGLPVIAPSLNEVGGPIAFARSSTSS